MSLAIIIVPVLFLALLIFLFKFDFKEFRKKKLLYTIKGLFNALGATHIFSTAWVSVQLQIKYLLSYMLTFIILAVIFFLWHLIFFKFNDYNKNSAPAEQ